MGAEQSALASVIAAEAAAIASAAMVRTVLGTFHDHVRAAHPDEWARMAAVQAQMNASGRFGLPRNVDGIFLGLGVP